MWQLFTTLVSKGKIHTLHVYVIWQHSWPEIVDLSFITVIHQLRLFVQEPLLYITKTKLRENNILIMQNHVTFMFINPPMEESISTFEWEYSSLWPHSQTLLGENILNFLRDSPHYFMLDLLMYLPYTGRLLRCLCGFTGMWPLLQSLIMVT